MTLSELRYVIAVAKTKHFGEAAKSCFVSQPTLSVAISKLEAKLGVCIFERSHNDIRITDIGEKIITQAERALQEINSIKQIAEASKSQLNSPLKIGGIFTIAPYLFPLLIPKLNKLAPKMPLIIQEDFTDNLRNKLQNGELDLIFISLPFTASGIVTKKLYHEPLMVLMRKDHPLQNKSAISSADLNNESVLLLGEGHCFRDQVMKVCPSCYTSGIQQTIEGTSLETLRHMVASGMGITILPSTATQVQHYHLILSVKPFKNKIPQRTVAVAWRVSFPRIKAIDAIINALDECKLNEIDASKRS